MTTKEKLSYFKTNKDVFGLRATLRVSLFHLLRSVLNRLPEDKFDSRFGVSTNGKIPLKELGIHNKDLILYTPTHERVMRHILKNLAIDYQEYIFIDIGCGKGRALLMAMLYPFKRVVGVELASLTSNVARNNIDIMKTNALVRCSNVEVQCVDATDFEIPAGNVVIYMYRPFIGDVLSKVLDNIIEHAHGNIIIAHSALGNDEERIFLSKGCLEKMKEYLTISIEHSWSLWQLKAKNN